MDERIDECQTQVCQADVYRGAASRMLSRARMDGVEKERKEK